MPSLGLSAPAPITTHKLESERVRLTQRKREKGRETERETERESEREGDNKRKKESIIVVTETQHAVPGED